MKSFALLTVGFVTGFATLLVLMFVFGDYEDAPSLPETPIVVAQSRVAPTETLPPTTETLPPTPRPRPPTSTPTPVPPSPTPLPTWTPVATAVPQTHLGDTVVRYGYSLSALTVENPATRPNTFYRPEAGKKLVAVELVIGNVSGEQFGSNELNATLADTDGFLYGGENTKLENDIELLDVNPDETVRGWIGFVIPQDATPASLRYDFGRTGQVIQVGLFPR